MPFTVMRNGGEGAACQLRDNGTTILMHYSRPPPSNLKMSEELAHNSFPPFPTCAWRSLVGCISPRRVQHMNQSGSEGPRSSPYFRRRRTITESQKQDECRKICVGSDANAIATLNWFFESISISTDTRFGISPNNFTSVSLSREGSRPPTKICVATHHATIPNQTSLKLQLALQGF